MSRYFFDVVGPTRSEYDFRGRELPSLDGAYHVAEMLALDLEVLHEETSAGCAISVRDADGKLFFSVPVRQPEPEPVADQS